jgi:thiosulfate/3-mercaptopyruvate sulfurtransferase
MTRFSFAALLVCVMLAPAMVRGESASTIPQSFLIQPDDLAKQLQSGPAPVILQVGFGTLYAQSHIPGALYAGPTRDEEGIENLRKQVKDLPKDKPLVIYCGCCPWSKCPNVAAAWKELTAEGFTQLKVLYIEENFGANWVDKGYPATQGS